MLIQTNEKINREIEVGQKEESNGKDKNSSACKGGQKIYRMPVVRAKGTVFA
jgi:hypothetical protein